MGRRKKGKSRRPEPKPEPSRSGPEPHPPRPNRPLLLFAVVLTTLWIVALVALAVFS
jgi:hypothetical protein